MFPYMWSLHRGGSIKPELVLLKENKFEGWRYITELSGFSILFFPTILGDLSPAPTSSLAPVHPRTLLLAVLVILLLKWLTWLTMKPKPSYFHQSPKALALAVWPPTRQKPVRPSSQVTFFPIILIPVANEDGLSQAMNTWAEDMHWAFDFHPIAASGKAEVKVPSRNPNYCPIGKYKQPGSIYSKGSLGNHTALFPLCLLGHEAACWPPPAQTGKNTSPSIIKVWNTPRIVQLIDYMSFAIMVSSLIICRSFWTQPFFQKCYLTTGLSYVAGNIN